MRHKLSSISIFGDFRYPNYTSARMGKQTVHMKINHLDTKGGDACEDAAKKSEHTHARMHACVTCINVIAERFLHPVISSRRL